MVVVIRTSVLIANPMLDARSLNTRGRSHCDDDKEK